MKVLGSWLLIIATIAFGPAPTQAQEPTIRTLALRGLRIGSMTTLVIEGDELGNAPRLMLPFVARQQLKPGATKNQAAFEVALGTDVEPGYYHLRVATDKGVSLPVVIAVDRLPQRLLAANVEQLPVALHGNVGGSAAAEARFAGKAGQKVLVEVEAQRLGSPLRPIIHLVGPRHVQLAWAWPSVALHGDARLEATLPEDGVFTVSVHDAEYAAPGGSFFRLRIGEWSFADRVFPPAVEKGRTQRVELLGSALAGFVDLGAARISGPSPVPWPKEGVFSGPRPFVLVSSHVELVRQVAATAVQDLPAGAVGVSGRLLVPHAEDRYRADSSDTLRR